MSTASLTKSQHHADHQAAIAAFQGGRLDYARDALVELARASFDEEVFNDLAVCLVELGELDRAGAVLQTAQALGIESEDLSANMSALAGRRAEVASSWRGSSPGGPDGARPERAFPGMPCHFTMSEHTMRYAFALSVVGGTDVLDLGCGTGYGSEILTWAAKRVRGFDLWQPEAGQAPVWPGGAELHFGHDICQETLPTAEAAVCFEVIEHLPKAPLALRKIFASVPLLVASFPNPEFHGSHLNPWHVNDWSLSRFEHELTEAAAAVDRRLTLEHFCQPQGAPFLVPGRNAGAAFWVVVARAVPA